MEKTGVGDPTSLRHSDSPVSYISTSSSDDDATQSFNAKRIDREVIVPPVDPSVLAEVEEQARHAGRSIEKMMAYLSKELKHGTAVTSNTVAIYDGTIDHVHGEVERNIKAMYGLIARCEELDRKMKPIDELARQVEDIKTMLGVLENICK